MTDPLGGISYNINTSGEAATHPHIRQPPFRRSHYNKMIRGCMLSRFPADMDDSLIGLHDGDCYFVHDAFRHGNDAGIIGAFKAGKKVVPKGRYKLYCSSA